MKKNISKKGQDGPDMFLMVILHQVKGTTTTIISSATVCRQGRPGWSAAAAAGRSEQTSQHIQGKVCRWRLSINLCTPGWAASKPLTATLLEDRQRPATSTSTTTVKEVCLFSDARVSFTVGEEERKKSGINMIKCDWNLWTVTSQLLTVEEKSLRYGGGGGLLPSLDWKKPIRWIVMWYG